MFSEKFTMYDDPLGPGSEARPFDDEGVASEKKYLVKKGDIDSFLYDRETAALASADEGGACSRGSYANPPVIGGSNITIAPGDWKNLEELDKFIEVHSVHGSHTANPTTGDIGLEVSTAFMVEKGKRTPVKGFMITGNAFDMLKNIEAMEKKTRTLDYFTAPRIAFRNVRIVS
jgi:PmbA protein